MIECTVSFSIIHVKNSGVGDELDCVYLVLLVALMVEMHGVFIDRVDVDLNF